MTSTNRPDAIFLLMLVCVILFCYCIIIFKFPNTCVLSTWNCRSQYFQNEAPETCSYNDFYDCFVFHEQRNFAEHLINNHISLKHLYRGLSLIDFRLQYAANVVVLHQTYIREVVTCHWLIQNEINVPFITHICAITDIFKHDKRLLSNTPHWILINY